MTEPHPYAAARAALKVLHEVFLERGHRSWSISPLKDGKPNFAHVGFEPLPPVAHLHWQTRFNHDGLLAYWPDPPPASQRLQLFRNGDIELVDTYSVQRIRAPEPVLLPLNLERDIVTLLATHGALQEGPRELPQIASRTRARRATCWHPTLPA